MKDFLKANKFKVLIVAAVILYALFLWARQIQNDFVPVRYEYDSETMELTFVAARIVTLEDCEIEKGEGTVLFPVEGEPFTVRVNGTLPRDGEVRVSYRDWKDRPGYSQIVVTPYTELPGVVNIDQKDQFGFEIDAEILP